MWGRGSGETEPRKSLPYALHLRLLKRGFSAKSGINTFKNRCSVKSSITHIRMDRIDVHSHFLPPEYRAACEMTGHGKPDGMPALPISEPSHNIIMVVPADLIQPLSNGASKRTWIL